jgi:hypothetical protein
MINSSESKKTKNDQLRHERKERENNNRTGMQRRFMHGDSVIFQHMQQRRFTSIVQAQEKYFGILAVKT